jgi:hypothetical protein
VRELEDEVRARLTTLAEGLDPIDVTERVIRKGRLRRRRRTTVALLSSALAVLTVVAAAVIVADRGSPARSLTTSPGPMPAVGSSPHNGVPEASFSVAAPILAAPSGPVPANHRPCHPGDVSAQARLRTTSYGVIGVVAMHGADCSLHISTGPTQLLDAERHPIVTAEPPSGERGQNPPGNWRPDLALAAGNAAWGFAWRGSWCGAPAAFVVVPLQDDRATAVAPHSYGQLVVPVTGPQLGCRGQSQSQLVPGVSGGLDTPVQSPPEQWSQGLEVSLTVPTDAASNGKINGITAVIRNHTGTAISLYPCPYYELDTGESDPRGSERDSGRAALTPCNSATVVPAHGELSFSLPPTDYGGGSPLGHGGASPGSLVHMWFAIAGLPTTTATTHVS